MPPRIHSMTSGQTNRVCENVLKLTRAWLLDQDASDGQYGGAAAFADLGRDCYVGIVKFTYAPAVGQPVEGELVWQLNHAFEPLGQPEVRLVEESET